MFIVVHLFLLISTAIIILYNVCSNSIAEGKLAGVFYNLSLSYVVSYIFFLVALAPQRRNQKILRSYVLERIDEIVMWRNDVLYRIIPNPEPEETVIESEYDEVTQEMVYAAMDKLDLSASSNVGRDDQRYTWAQYMTLNMEKTKEAGEKIKSYAMYVDIEILKAVNSILDCDYAIIARGALANKDLSVFNTRRGRSRLREEFWFYSEAVDDLDYIRNKILRPTLVQRVLSRFK
ncbi:hypothetical protein [Alicyclobacillus fastidiosus]|uniref:Uncharacterized protein n=1 Tax=Alicyclobacillus fastidiosus TaxID=392011 RepID=A0ABV5AL07_9BACL